MEMQNQPRQILFRNRPLVYDSFGGDTSARSSLPVVIFLHGFTEDRRIWRQLVPGLRKDFRYLVPDLPGSGSSADNPDLRELDDFAGAVEAIRLDAQLGQIILIGHSMGGYIAMAYAERYPGPLTGLGLFHSSARADTAEKKTARGKNQDFIGRHGSAAFVRQALPGLYSPAFRDAHPQEIEEEIVRYANFSPEMLVLYLEAMKNRPDRTGRLLAADVPVLFIGGENDQVITPASLLEQCHIPRISYFHSLPRTAHMGMVENPTLCISILDRFLDQFTW